LRVASASFRKPGRAVPFTRPGFCVALTALTTFLRQQSQVPGAFEYRDAKEGLLKMADIIERLREELRQKGDAHTKESGARFFKEDVRLYGLTMPAVDRLAKVYYEEIRQQSKHDIFTLCEELWRSGYLEESFVACNWSHAIRSQYQPEDIEVFERWVSEYVSNWATCDTLCNHSVGDLLEMYPAQVDNLRRWARSENRWMRRAAAVSLIIPARRSRFLADVFAIADILLLDADDLVRKGYGWMLKAASEAHQSEVFDYVMRHKAVMPRTALRYAIEKMPPDLKARAMAK
jgi:3-methyladenine DNA glycosylase AlkD